MTSGLWVLLTSFFRSQEPILGCRGDVKAVVMEGERPLGGEHTIGRVDAVRQDWTPGTYARSPQ